MNIKWMPKVPISPEHPNFIPFDESPIKPKEIRGILKTCNLNSKVGPDGVNYKAIIKLSCLHGILATLFTKILKTGSPPIIWSESIVKLIYKKEILMIKQIFR